jgi:hypothetical protein
MGRVMEPMMVTTDHWGRFFFKPRGVNLLLEILAHAWFHTGLGSPWKCPILRLVDVCIFLLGPQPSNKRNSERNLEPAGWVYLSIPPPFQKLWFLEAPSIYTTKTPAEFSSPETEDDKIAKRVHWLGSPQSRTARAHGWKLLACNMSWLHYAHGM